MKRKEIHLLNRIYIYPPDKKVLPHFGDTEDVIDPEKVVAVLDQLHTMEYDEIQHNVILQLHLPKVYQDTIHRDTFYMMTKNREMFQLLKDLNYEDEEAVFDWLIHYWQISFLMTFPIYLYNALPYTFHLKTMSFEACSYSYSYFIEHGLHVIGNGVTLFLSLNSAGWISNEMTWNVLTRFMEKMDYDGRMYDIPKEWIMYYCPHYLHITDFPFLYAFQFCNPLIYRMLYKITSSTGIIFKNNESIYISNIFTINIQPKKHHYKFIKETKQSNFYIQDVNSNLHFNIHHRLKTILQSSSEVKRFLSNKYNRRFLIHCIYKNKRLGLLKFIQSICYLYNNPSYSKRYLKLIWRNIMNEFKGFFVQMMNIYLLEYFLLESNAKSAYSLLCPPLKMLRDVMYVLKDYFSIHKKIEFSMIIAKKHQCFLPIDLFQSPKAIYSNHQKYNICISFLELLELLKDYHPLIQSYLQALNKKRMLLLQCFYKTDYSIYKVMQNYYRNNPDALWKS
uniref:Uncharacterized protein n=1 Tax=viral metagenome TaxID=1070528 RepID=A0A6C0CSC7_9ZZZZ